MVAVTLNNLASLANQTSAINTINGNNATITQAFTDCLSINDTSSNTMGVDMNMNGHRILNLASPGSTNEPLRLADITLVPPVGVTFGSPTNLVGLTAVNGVASTIAHSDSAPALDQSISPTWSGTHTFNITPAIPGGTIVTTTGTQTLTNKTLTTPIVSTISNTGTLTLPTTTDTLVGKATTDTLTNKTLTSPTINSPTITSPSFGSSNITTTGNLSITGTSSQTGTITAGADVQAAGYIRSGGFNRLTSDFPVTSSTTLTSTGLSVSLTTGVSYIFEFTLYFPGAGQNNVKLALAGTATASAFLVGQPIWIRDGGNNLLGTGTTGTFVSLPATIVNTASANGNDSWMYGRGFITCNGTGTLIIQMAQASSSGTTQTMKAGSTIMVYQVA